MKTQQQINVTVARAENPRIIPRISKSRSLYRRRSKVFARLDYYHSQVDGSRFFSAAWIITIRKPTAAKSVWPPGKSHSQVDGSRFFSAAWIITIRKLTAALAIAAAWTIPSPKPPATPTTTPKIESSEGLLASPVEEDSTHTA